MIKDLNVRDKLENFQKNIERFCDIKLGKESLDMISKAQGKKEQKRKIGFH